MGHHLLVVEDSTVQAELIQHDLTAAGYDVTMASSGEEALVELDRLGRSVDAVVSDVMMPGIDGYELCRQIKRRRDLEGVPVVLLTSLRDPVDIVRGLECGADNFITKPYELDQLLHRLDTVLRSNDLRMAGRFRMGVEVLVLGHTFTVSADRQQILDMLMSSFEELVHTNDRLREREEQLEAAQSTLHEQVTLAERRQRDLEASRNELQTTLEHARVATWSLDVASGTLAWSSNVHQILHLEPTVPLDTVDAFLAAVVPEDRQPLSAYVDGLARGDTDVLPDEWGFRVVGVDGTTRWLASRGHGHHVDGTLGASGVTMDVTHNRELELELQRARDEAEAANRAKSDYLSRMSHELRTPMNSVLGFAQLLELSELAPPDRDSVDRILGAGRHLLQLIDDVLDIARIEAGRLSISLEPVPLHAVVGDAVALLRPQLDDGQFALSVEVGEDVRVTADQQRLAQVLINLLSNAIKYNRPRGEIAVTCSTPRDGWCRVAVVDTGPGIPSELRDRLFQTFERLEAEQTDVPGTGLGLALSRTLVHAMGGEIGCDSTPGRGSTFWIDLPLAGPTSTDGVPQEAACDPEPTDGASAPATILYVEDNPLNVELVERALATRPDTQLRHASSGDVGLQLVREVRPDLVLLDLQLPGMSGVDVLRHLRADPDTAGIPVVVLSADVTVDSSETALLEGAAAYLTKPLNLRELRESVDGHLAVGDPPTGPDPAVEEDL